MIPFTFMHDVVHVHTYACCCLLACRADQNPNSSRVAANVLLLGFLTLILVECLYQFATCGALGHAFKECFSRLATLVF